MVRGGGGWGWGERGWCCADRSLRGKLCVSSCCRGQGADKMICERLSFLVEDDNYCCLSLSALFCIFLFTYFWAVRSRNTKRSNIMLLGILWRRFNIAGNEWDPGKILGRPGWAGRGLVWKALFFGGSPDPFLGAVAHTHRGPGRLFKELWNLVSLH